MSTALLKGTEVANHFLDQVLQCDDPGGAAVLLP